jgi:hypothetical protein
MYFAFKGHIYYIKPLQGKRKNEEEESIAGEKIESKLKSQGLYELKCTE